VFVGSHTQLAKRPNQYTSGRGARKVAHVITGLGTGGAETMLANLAIAEQAAGNAPLVISLLSGGSTRERLIAAGVEVHQLGMRPGWRAVTGLWQLIRLIRARRPDVIQSWMYHADLASLVALWLSGRRRRTRLFWGIRCSDMDWSRYRSLSRLVMRVSARLSRFPDAVVVNSEAGRAWHARLGYRPRRFILVDNGLDPERYVADPAARAAVRAELGLAPDAVVVGAVARVDPMKDYPTLLAALGRLDGIVCVAVGSGTQRLPPTPGLLPLGERRDVPRLLNAFDVFVSASAFGEGFSNAIIEAMAAGLPVVATDVGDARRIVGDAGVIVPPGDAALLAEAIRGLAGDPGRRRALGQRARARVEAQFTLARAAASFEALYCE
jgi:glycosyltransferase involved in cell wall biosynthesis